MEFEFSTVSLCKHLASIRGVKLTLERVFILGFKVKFFYFLVHAMLSIIDECLIAILVIVKKL